MPLIAAGETTSKFSRCVGTLVATLAAFSIGTYLSWSSSALPHYRRSDTLRSVGDQEASWITSLLPLGAIPSVLPAVMLADKFGRKRTIWAAGVLLFTCWYIVAFARTETWLFLARFAAGSACGAASVVVPMFISEIAERRSTWDSLGVFRSQITAGILFAYATAFADGACVIAILCSAAPALLLISLPFVPESPVWLQDRRTCDTLSHFGGSSRAETGSTKRVAETRAGISELWDHRHRRPICIVLGLIFFQQLSGVNALIFHASEIFDTTGVSSPDPVLSSVIVGVVQLIATCFSTVIIERANKKLLLFVSASTMATSMFTLSGYFHFQNSRELSSVFWIPLLSCAVFIATFSLGFGPLPWMMLGELFAENARRAAVPVVAMWSWTLAFLATKCFRNMVDLMGTSSSFATFGMISLIGAAFVSALVPERRTKSAEEVQIELCRACDRNRRELAIGTRPKPDEATETPETTDVAVIERTSTLDLCLT
ncbi:PREDICTED: facilitated trehalose transporter Tret1-like isoform X1 [Dinoponera quadriceps]|uniref:Facilitated trehalose transporter Tret1-like isoform X1 n=1 Tax=Dinoponera quadriceps TaxID=609295 RepID=A0A6P3Y7K4_DINQU|nr:PREDICTED: facilitated trehalose transporter Tret1-like isoform X1 [Dinoponera quadriceps]